MSTLEISGIQDPVVRHARTTGWLAWKMKIEGRRGCPDYWFFRAGVTVIIEFKAPEKSRSVQQVLRANELQEKGHRVYVIDNVDEGRELLDRLVKRIDALMPIP